MFCLSVPFLVKSLLEYDFETSQYPIFFTFSNEQEESSGLESIQQILVLTVKTRGTRIFFPEKQRTD